MSDICKLDIEGHAFELPIVEGSEGERAIDIRDLRRETGLITLDDGFMNTGSCTSRITFIDGEQGILRYRGIPIEQLAAKSTFVETCYLLVRGRLPTASQLQRFSDLLNEFSLIHEDMRHFFNFFPRDAHPMNTLGTMVNALSSFYPNVDSKSMGEEIDVTTTRLISKIRTLAAFAFRKSVGQRVVYPDGNLKYCENFLNMMFSSPVRPYTIDPDHVRALNMLLIMHADHEQNCSTSVVRLVGSSQANLYAAISSGIAALWGPLHGGANQAVIDMLERIRKDGGSVDSWIERAKDKSKKKRFRLSGFGHRVYKNYDPRARIIKALAMKIADRASSGDPLLEIALELEDKVLQDDYFAERKLFPNVDFYSGLIYKSMGFPTDMFTVLFAIGRMPGWIAQWREMANQRDAKIGRPRQIYLGHALRDYAPIEERGQ